MTDGHATAWERVTTKLLIVNAGVPSCLYGSFVPVVSKGDDMRYIALVVLVLALAACGSPSHTAAVARATPSFSVRAATVQACKTVLAFENGNANDNFGQDPASVQALNQAEDTPLEADLQAWVNDLQDSGTPYQQTEQDADTVGADCGALGVLLTL